MSVAAQYQQQFYDLTTNRKYHEALALIEQLIECHVDQKVIMLDVIAKTLQNFQRFDEDPNSSGFSSLTLLAIARICDDALKKVFTHATMEDQYVGNVLIGTPQNEFHSLGKTIISAFLRLYNWKVTDIGMDNSAEKFITEAEAIAADYILVSTFLLPSALKCAEISAALQNSTLINKTRLVVGGPPFNFHLGLAEKLGCDATAVDAFDTIRVLNKLHGIDTEAAGKMERTKRFQRFKKRVFNLMRWRK